MRLDLKARGGGPLKHSCEAAQLVALDRMSARRSALEAPRVRYAFIPWVASFEWNLPMAPELNPQFAT